MASYQYLRDIKESDLAPDAAPEYTRKQKLQNWWHYHWKLVLGGLLAAAMAVSFAKDVLFKGPQPDHVISIVAAQTVPEEVCAALQQALAPYADDRNGDGTAVLAVQHYTLNFNPDTALTEGDAYAQMAGSTQLSADFQSGTSYVFLVQDPAGMVGYTQAMQYLDGTLPPEVDPGDEAALQALTDQWPQMFYAWGDCPVLAGLELGSYTAVDGAVVDLQQYLSNLYVGRRGIWTEQSAQQLAGCDILWQVLTAGAAQ